MKEEHAGLLGVGVGALVVAYLVNRKLEQKEKELKEKYPFLDFPSASPAVTGLAATLEAIKKRRG